MGNYDKFAEKYAIKTAGFKAEIKSRKHYRSLLPPNLKGKKILDVGCGSAQDAIYYFSKKAQVFGIDISKKEIEMAKNMKCGEFTIGDMKNLPYQNNTFDIVASYYALQASDNVTKSIEEMIRVAKRGAMIVILTKSPIRNLLEGWKNNNKKSYYKKGIITSYIFKKTIKLNEPSHKFEEYLNKNILQKAELLLFEEHSDFPASDQVIPNLIYPTYLILKFRKK